MKNRVRTPVRDVPVLIGAIMVEVAAEFGVTASQVLAGTTLDEGSFASPDTRISMRDYSRMLNNCVRTSHQPAFGLVFGSRIPIVATGVLGHALMCCRNVQELIEVLMRYHRLLGGSFHLDVVAEQRAMAIRMLGGIVQDLVQPIDCEIFFAAAAAALRQLTSSSEPVLHVELGYADPGYAKEYRRLICGDVVFEAPENRLLLDRSCLDMPLQFANPTLLKLYRQQCDELLASMKRSAEYTSEVRRYLLSLPGRFPSIDDVASHLHVSTRTLRRRLDVEGTTYQKLLHELRRQLAETYLRDSLLSIAEIAELLGYTDISNFRRAFISWAGHSPSGYRRRLRRDETGPANNP